MKKLAMKMLSLLLVLSLLLPTCVFAQPGQDGDGTPGTQGAAMENADAPTGGGSGGEDVDVPTGGGNGDGDADAPTGGGNGDETSKDENGDGNTKDVNGGSVTQSTTSEKTTTFTEGEDGDGDADVSEEEETLAIVSETNVVGTSAADDGLTDAERLEAYLLYSQENGGAGGSGMRRTRQKPLNAETQAVYDRLKTKVEAIIGGTVSNTVFDLGTVFTWTDVDLGTTGNFGTVSGGTLEFTDATNTAINNRVGKVGVDTILQRLLSEMPYELFWFDKAYGSSGTTPIKAFAVERAISGSGNATSGTVTVAYTVKMVVAKDYASGGAMGGYDIDTSKITRVTTAKSNAESIKATHASATNYEKLVSYRNEICRLVAYDTNTYNNLDTTPYGDPWQLINVFDHNNNDGNAVVCEGYAKAFKYLCDLTWTGASPAVECYLVTGNMTGGTGEGGSGAGGGHMWNVVHIGGNNYLVDVTNCDTGTIGATDKLFLCGVENQTNGESYRVTIGSSVISFSYDAATKEYYTKDELTLSGVKYTPPAQETPTVTGTLTAAVTFGDAVDNADIKSTGVTVAVGSTTVAGEFQWDGVTSYGDAGTKTLNAKFVPADSTKYTTVACTVDVTVNKKTVNDPTIVITPDSCKYTGSSITPTVTVKDGGTVIPDSEYSLNYTSNTNVGTASVEVVDSGAGNYLLTGTLTKNFDITPGEIPAEVVNGVTGYSGTYDGNPHNAVVVDSTATSGYMLAYKGSGSATYSSTMPQVTSVAQSGDVWVKLSKTNYADKEIKVTATVSQKDIGGATITLSTAPTYDGTEKQVTISGVTVAGLTLTTSDYDISTGTDKATNVEPKELQITGKGNYTGTAQEEWSLKAKELTLPSAAAENKVYDGSDTATINGGALSGVVSGDDVALAADSVGGTFDSRYAGTNISVTADAFALTGTKAGNYTLTQPTGLKADITAADQNPTIIGTATLAKGGSELDLSTLVNGAMGDVSFSISSGTSSATLSVTTLKSTDTTGVVKIDVNITPRSVGGDSTPEYNAYAKTAAITVTVADKTSAPLAGGVTQSDCTFGETPADPVFTTPAGTTSTTYFYEGTLTKDGTYYTGLSKPTEAGNYMVKVTCETATHIYTEIALFTIEQKDISGMDVTLSKSTTPYTGSSQSVTVSSVGTLILGEYTVGGTTSGTQVGTYTVTVTGHGNYKGTADKTWEIKKATLTITGATVAAKTYDGTDGATVSSVTFSGLASGETLALGTDYDVSGVFNSANVSSANKVTVTVTLKDTATAKNYELASATYDVTGQSIAQATTPAAPTGLTGVKGNALSTVTLPSGWTWVNGSTVMNTVGPQTFKANYNDAAGNYASATNVDVAVNVMNKTDVGGKISFNDGTLVYTGAGQKYETASISGITAGTGVTWTYGYTAGTGTLDSGLPKTVGTYTVTVTYEDNLNYGTKSVTLTITQATPTGAPKFTKITSSGKTLGDAALVKAVSGPGDGFSVAGTVEWVDGSGTALADSTSVEANKSYGWKFTPTDSNYKSISGSVVVYTVRRVSHSGGAAVDSAAAAAAQPTVYSGSRGESVKTLQEKLNAKGYNAGSVDGIFGKNTQAAVMAFQKANGLAADGIVGKLTWAKLYDTTAALPAASTATGTQPTVYRGSRGDAVRKLQELLNKKGFDCGAVDGIFGSKTYAAVMAFQKANGLSADGIVGPLTWGKLG